MNILFPVLFTFIGIAVVCFRLHRRIAIMRQPPVADQAVPTAKKMVIPKPTIQKLEPHH